MIQPMRLILCVLIGAAWLGGTITPAALSQQSDWTCPDTWDTNDCSVLQDLYTSTDGPNWHDNTNWGTANTPWHGVTTNDSGQVIRLYLESNALSGTMPDSLGNLTQLEELWLSYNELSGTIPPGLGNLSQLKTLTLEYNELRGTIPPGLGHLDQLVVLDISHNQLRGSIPPSLGHLSQLGYLSLGGNPLRGIIPDSLGHLSQLAILDLSSSRLSGSIPPSLGHLSQLVILNLSDNYLSGVLPDWLDGDEASGHPPLTRLIGMARNCGLTTQNLTVRAFLDDREPDWQATQADCP